MAQTLDTAADSFDPISHLMAPSQPIQPQSWRYTPADPSRVGQPRPTRSRRRARPRGSSTRRPRQAANSPSDLRKDNLREPAPGYPCPSQGLRRGEEDQLKAEGSVARARTGCLAIGMLSAAVLALALLTPPPATAAKAPSAAAQVASAGRKPRPHAHPDGRAVNCKVRKCIALTFDDGPGPYTHRLLRELADKHTHATFFLIGRNVAAHPHLVRQEVRAGHAIGNHTWDHPDLTTLTPRQVRSQIDRTARAIKRAAGISTDLVRPPYGATDAKVDQQLRRRGDAEILWNVDTQDWLNRSTSITTERALAGATRGGIILMHDIRPTTVDAVPRIIHELRQRGYALVTIPVLLGHVRPGHRYYSRS